MAHRPALLLNDATETPEQPARRAREVVEEVLSRPEFAGLGEREPGWMERMGEAIGRVLGSLGRTLEGLPDVVFWLLIGLLVVALLAVVIQLVHVLVQATGSGGSGLNRREAEPSVGSSVAELRWRAVYRDATELAGRQRWTEAVRRLHLAALLRLDEAGLIAFDRSRTNGQYLAELAASPRWVEPLQQMTRLFERTVYAGRGAGAEEYRRMERAFGAVRDGLDQPAEG